ncbi:Phage tail fiber repeat [Escherichia coli]|uniref:tail fiber protein n=1 Tax=Escherichia coli TaxID=562 RepID=UPI0010CC007E|nr:tail fiber protein [Escherichia coli]EES5102092.1 phage tail protein [Escherichia coli]EJG2956451.1 phage tail protein [Escherichia coli]CAD5659739.1 Phage tail fiber repeat [Escherichia coli]CAD5662146.1 Phage tail fiber repeat [Escherichia coli]GDN28910.1 phage tail fiber [Escherichia coli]
MSTKFKTVITTAGAAKLAAATAPGGRKVNITTMAVGDGGGKLPVPDAGQTGLIHEVWRHALNKISQDKRNSNYIIAELVIPPEVGGFWMRELGLYDDAGTLIAVANMAESYKSALAEGSGRSQTCRMVIIVSSVASVELTIDTTTVMATQDYVDDKIAEHEQSRRHPDASLTAKGFTQLSSATNSTSETLAATPKAVKAAYDLANGKYTAQDATTARKGLVQLSSATNSTSETLAATPKAVKAAYDLANGKYTAQDATTARKGLVQLSSATNSDSETLAATPKAVKSAYDNAEKRLQKDQNGADIPGKDTFTKNIGACRAYSGALSTEAGNWTTAQFIEWLDSRGAFNHPYWMCKCSWSYGNNKIITDTGCGTIHLAGCVIEVMGNKGAMTIRVTTPSTSTGGGTTNAQFTYINHGDAYAPGWRRDYNTKNQQPAFALGQTGSRVANDKAVGWNWNSGVYDADISGASTLILHFNMNAGSCPAVQFRVNYKNGGIFYRSARDGYGFEADWSEFYTTTRKPSAGDVGAYTKAESDSRYVRDIRLGTRVVQTMQKGVMYEKSGHVITGLGIVGEVDGDDPAVFRPIQKYINGTWYNVAQV